MHSFAFTSSLVLPSNALQTLAVLGFGMQLTDDGKFNVTNPWGLATHDRRTAAFFDAHEPELRALYEHGRSACERRQAQVQRRKTLADILGSD